MDDRALAPRPRLGRRLAVIGAYTLAFGLSSVSVGGLLGVGGLGLVLLPGAGSAGGALAIGLAAGALVAGIYVAAGLTVRTIFDATQRAERALIDSPLPGQGHARAGDLSLPAGPDERGALSPRRT